MLNHTTVFVITRVEPGWRLHGTLTTTFQSKFHVIVRLKFIFVKNEKLKLAIPIM